MSKRLLIVLALIAVLLVTLSILPTPVQKIVAPPARAEYDPGGGGCGVDPICYCYTVKSGGAYVYNKLRSCYTCYGCCQGGCVLWLPAGMKVVGIYSYWNWCTYQHWIYLSGYGWVNMSRLNLGYCGV